MIPTAEHRRARHRETRGGAASRPIVACVAGASTDRAVAAIAGSLARPLDAPLLLTTVQQPGPGTASGDDVTSLLASVARELEWPPELRVASGEPAERLLALAEREAAALVVVAAPRRPPAASLRLGNVHLALAGAAPCPVVVVPTGVTALREDGPIVCGVDGSAPSSAAAQVGADLAGRLGTQLLLVHVAPGLRAAGAPGRILQHTAERLRETAPNYLLVEYGTPAERLAAVAERERASLLITGSRGRGRSASALLGSVASRLAAAATRPLLIVPSGDDRAWSLTTRRLRSGSALLCVRGQIDPSTAGEMEDAADRLLDETGRLVIDLSDATTIERAGMQVVERLARRANDTGARLALVTPSPAVRRARDGFPHPVTDALDAALEVVTG